MRASIYLTVLVLVAAACTTSSGETATSSKVPESTTSTTVPPASSGSSTVTTEPPVASTTTTEGATGFCPTVEMALVAVEAADDQVADPQLEDMWALLRTFYLRLEPVAPAELEEPIELILSSAEHFEARARDPEGVASPTEEEGDAFNTAIATVMAYVETECGISTIDAVPLG